MRRHGRVYWHSELTDDLDPLPDDLDDGDKYVVVPHQNELDLGKPLALRFASERLTADYSEVSGIFNRRGAYGRFKDLSDRRGMLEEWYEFESQARERALRQWCRDSGIKVEG